MAVILEGEILEKDVHDVVSSWFSYKNPIPEGWKGKTSPMYAFNPTSHQVLMLVSLQKTDEIS